MTEWRRFVNGESRKIILDANGVSAAALIQNYFVSTIDESPERSIITDANERRGGQGGTPCSNYAWLAKYGFEPPLT